MIIGVDIVFSKSDKTVNPSQSILGRSTSLMCGITSLVSIEVLTLRRKLVFFYLKLLPLLGEDGRAQHGHEVVEEVGESLAGSPGVDLQLNVRWAG